MNNITFKYAPKKTTGPERLVLICLSAFDYLLVLLLVRLILGYGVSLGWTDAISGLLLSVLFSSLFSLGKTTVDFSARIIIYSPAPTCPSVKIKIDEIESVHPYEHWYDRRNLLLKTTTGKKRRISVDCPERFVALLIKENKLIQSPDGGAKY